MEGIWLITTRLPNSSYWFWMFGVPFCQAMPISCPLSTETRLTRLGYLRRNTRRYFPRIGYFRVEDDHIPFLKRGKQSKQWARSSALASLVHLHVEGWERLLLIACIFYLQEYPSYIWSPFLSRHVGTKFAMTWGVWTRTPFGTCSRSSECSLPSTSASALIKATSIPVVNETGSCYF